MPFCTQCAHAIPNGARFCPSCGAAVAAAPPPPAAQLGASQIPTEAVPPRPPSSSASPSSSIHGRFEPGTRLGTRYRVVGLLGRGGMGEVYRADDLELGQSVALKFLPPAVATDPAELTRFRGEVRIARLIAHPNVCRVYDIGEVDGNVFLSMEYIDGEDLASVLRRMGRPTSDKAVEIARQICLGLAAAHEAGMLHRDLKPANVMVDGRGRARITDFGLAGLAEDLARGGEHAGTPAYMAPEQLQGGRVSVRSDIYSLGLLLYELFTGKRAFEAKNIPELRQMHESGSVPSPSDFARDIDPAIERLILHCLERDPDQRPPSAYAVLGALPGADPLAAALAAGETPSPELIANTGVRGATSGPVVASCLALGIAGIAVWAGLIGPEFRPLTQPTSVLSVRAADVLTRSGVFGALPEYSEHGFAQNPLQLRHQRTDRRLTLSARTSVFFWRRWSPRQIVPAGAHQELVRLHDPAFIPTGGAAVLLDPAGRLIGFRTVPPDSAPAVNDGHPSWAVFWQAAGLDPSTFVPTAPPRAIPAMCDSFVAWRGGLPWASGEPVAVQMGASRGRLTYFTIVHDWGVTTTAVDSLGADPNKSADWPGFVLFVLLPLVASIMFGVRNLQTRRGDWRGATRIALFVFVMNFLVGLFRTRITEIGLLSALYNLVDDRTFAHAILHGVEMWLAYAALEPYVRRIWPQMLVGWSRLLAGRVRDPLVGRDLLVGVASGATLMAISVLGQFMSVRAGLARNPSLLSPEMLISVTDLSATACSLAYSGSICILTALQILVSLVVVRLMVRRTWLAVAVCYLSAVAAFAASAAPDYGWAVSAIVVSAQVAVVFVLVRFGVLAGVTALFTSLVTGSAVPSLDLSSWYADRGLVSMFVLAAIMGYGAVTALAGKSILSDPLRDPAAR